jgi:hypothetical protein
MSDRARLLVAALVLVVGLVAAVAIPQGTCTHGELVEDLVESDTYTCKLGSDVFTAARSLIVLKYVVGIGSVIAALALAASVLVRRRRAASGGVGGFDQLHAYRRPRRQEACAFPVRPGEPSRGLLRSRRSFPTPVPRLAEQAAPEVLEAQVHLLEPRRVELLRRGEHRPEFVSLARLAQGPHLTDECVDGVRVGREAVNRNVEDRVVAGLPVHHGGILRRRSA